MIFKVLLIGAMVLNLGVQFIVALYVNWRNTPRAEAKGSLQVLGSFLVSTLVTSMFAVSIGTHTINLGTLNQVCGYVVLQLLIYWLGFGLGRPLAGPLRE